MDDEELGFKVHDVIRVIDMSNADWWLGELESKEGWFPATFVRVRRSHYSSLTVGKTSELWVIGLLVANNDCL